MTQTILIIIAFIIAGCSSSVKTMFEEKEEKYEIADNLKVSDNLAKKFKTVEPSKEKVPPKKKKRVAKKKKPKKIKKYLIPKEFRDKYQAMDNNSRKVWEQHKPIFKAEEEIVIRIYFFGLTVGHLKMSVKPMVHVGEREAYHFQARMKSAKYYSYFYSLDNTVDSYLDFKTLSPLKYSGIQRESKQSIDDLQLFDIDKRKTFAWFKRVKKDKDKEFKRETYTPEFFMDIYSAFYFTRGLPMTPGNQYTLPVVSRAKIYMFNMEVMGVEKVKVNRRTFEGYKIKATSITDDGKKKGEVFFWYSTDPSRKLLKFTAKVKIGTIKGELVDYKLGPQLDSSNVARKKTLKNVSTN